MSIWNKTSEKLPPLKEDVLILYKDKKDKISKDNLYYGVANVFNIDPYYGATWSRYTEYQGYYEVVYWTPLVDMPMNLFD